MVVSTSANALARDLDEVLARMDALWEGLRGARIFITGGTGFFGCWLLETLLWAEDRLQLGATVAVLSRDPAAFRAKAPHLASHAAVALHAGDVRDFTFPESRFTHMIHAAVDATPPTDQASRRHVVDVVVSGTYRALKCAAHAGVRRFLFTSTGAVYGRQPDDLERIPEEYGGGPDSADPGMAGAEAKRAAEMLCAVHAEDGLQPTIARCFAFVGPYLPVDGKFAAGNFLRDALGGRPIRITSDGTSYRSYLYGSDLAIWLWTILLRGATLRPYNVGSQDAISIAGLASAVAACAGTNSAVEIEAAPSGRAPQRYVPSTERARRELDLVQHINLHDALTRTADWLRVRGGAA
jgi:dTDP-glucose 4,6-dehydratase